MMVNMLTKWQEPRTEAHRMVVSVVRVAGRLQREADRFLRDYDITVAQFNALVILAPHENGLPQSEIGDALVVSKANVTGLVARLQKLGLCLVATDRDDGRIKRVRLSKKGERLLERIDRPYFREIERLTEGLTEAQVARVTQTLDRLMESIP